MFLNKNNNAIGSPEEVRGETAVNKRALESSGQLFHQ